ncbi:single-stranded DNA-binding protein [Paenarthrobacter histidinolovorans]|uniref:single-stranded DNA-binding protein n=1 Tax=Paenarthrobacter histidinolovorans TaxID=43664 RepID=UPI00384D3C99
MAGETTITVIGNLTSDPELRFTPSGSAVANFTIASTPRIFDRQSNEWKDGETLFLRASVWREAAENVAESLTKGTRVIVSGPVEVPVLRNQGRREAHRDRTRGRRDRPVPAVRQREGQPHTAQQQPGRRNRGRVQQPGQDQPARPAGRPMGGEPASQRRFLGQRTRLRTTVLTRTVQGRSRGRPCTFALPESCEGR